MITIISCTNRLDSNTIRVAQYYKQILQENLIESMILSLDSFPQEVLHDMMSPEGSEAFVAIERKYLYNATKIIFILPEYNGSYPGILKTFIDGTDIKKSFHGKKALLVGIATGRSGNVRGMDHLTSVLNYLKVFVHWNKIALSKINDELNEMGLFYKPETIKVIKKQIDEFIAF